MLRINTISRETYAEVKLLELFRHVTDSAFIAQNYSKWALYILGFETYFSARGQNNSLCARRPIHCIFKCY